MMTLSYSNSRYSLHNSAGRYKVGLTKFDRRYTFSIDHSTYLILLNYLRTEWSWSHQPVNLTQYTAAMPNLQITKSNLVLNLHIYKAKYHSDITIDIVHVRTIWYKYYIYYIIIISLLQADVIQDGSQYKWHHKYSYLDPPELKIKHLLIAMVT